MPLFQNEFLCKDSSWHRDKSQLENNFCSFSFCKKNFVEYHCVTHFARITPSRWLKFAPRLTNHQTNLQSTDNGLALVSIFNYVPVNDAFVSVLHRGTATSQWCCYCHVTAIFAFHWLTVWIQKAHVIQSEVWYKSFVNVHSHLVVFTLNRNHFAKFS